MRRRGNRSRSVRLMYKISIEVQILNFALQPRFCKTDVVGSAFFQSLVCLSCVGLVALLHFSVWICAVAKMQMCYQMRWLFCDYVVVCKPFNTNENVLPAPKSLFTVISPPCASINSLLMLNPNPVPSFVVPGMRK